MTEKAVHYILAGGSGFVGRALIQELISTFAARQENLSTNALPPKLTITVLSRTQASLKTLALHPAVKDWLTQRPDVKLQLCCYADLLSAKSPAKLSLEDAVFVNLAGENIAAKRLGKRRLHALLQSRLHSIKLCQELMSAGCGQPRLFVQASSLSILADNDVEQTDTAPLADSPLADILKELEAAAHSLPCPSLCLRLPLVLGCESIFTQVLSALPRLWLIDGSNYLPTASVKDCARALIFCAEQGIEGCINCAAPAYFTSTELLKTAGIQPAPNSDKDKGAAPGASIFSKVKNTLPPLPLLLFLIKLSSLFDMRSALLLENKKINAQRLLQAGFKFKDLCLKEQLKA